ncbi:MAG: TIGR02452 family protein [Lachnospiraceae bacterium]|nr:TIGR02452 family protein [Lachnospiraceae bacterium]
MLNSNMREERIHIFDDTEWQCKKNQKLKEAISKTRGLQYAVSEEEQPKGIQEGHRYTQKASLVVSGKRSLEAAGAYKGKKVCVHNFASATSAGGGVKKGSSAQEEAICRCSTLYFNISKPEIAKEFHLKHKNALQAGTMNVTYNDDCIYSPGIVVFKSDTDHPEALPEQEWYSIDVITCAAPNLRKNPVNSMNPYGGKKPVELSEDELKALHIKRMRRILDIAKAEQEEVVILGAFGCGAFANPPEVVAAAMKEVVEEYRYDFETIEFAVYCGSRDTKNYDVFKNTLS